MRSLIIVLFMIVSSFAQDNYSKKDIEKIRSLIESQIRDLKRAKQLESQAI